MGGSLSARLERRFVGDLEAQGESAAEQLTIGYVSGGRRDADLAPMAVAWKRIARRYRSVHFLLAGHHPPVLVDAVPPGRLTLRAPLELPDYPQLFAGVDIGCAPLAPTSWNKAKSPIRALEYGAAGAATVASPTVYGSVLGDGHTGYLATTVDEWEGALRRLIEDADLRQRMATTWARRVEEHHSLEANLWRWPAAWQRLVDAFRARQHAGGPRPSRRGTGR